MLFPTKLHQTKATGVETPKTALAHFLLLPYLVKTWQLIEVPEATKLGQAA